MKKEKEVELITRRQIVKKYGVSPLTVQNWHTLKKIRPIKKVGREYVYSLAEVEKFAANNKSTKDKEIYYTYGDREHGFALSLNGWRAYNKRKTLDDVPLREIFIEFDRPLEEPEDGCK